MSLGAYWEEFYILKNWRYDAWRYLNNYLFILLIYIHIHSQSLLKFQCFCLTAMVRQRKKNVDAVQIFSRESQVLMKNEWVWLPSEEFSVMIAVGHLGKHWQSLFTCTLAFVKFPSVSTLLITPPSATLSDTSFSLFGTFAAPGSVLSASVSVSGFPYEKVRERTLYLQVLDYDRFSRNDPIGEVSIPLNKVELGQMKTFWKELKPCSDGSVRW